MGKRKLESGNNELQRVSAGVVSEASYFARRCGLTTEEAVALMIADHGFLESETVPIKKSKHHRKVPR
ncbi:hypothetical protein ACVDG8_029455 [Mesorhizobium sp. ORM8.1]